MKFRVSMVILLAQIGSWSQTVQFLPSTNKAFNLVLAWTNDDAYLESSTNLLDWQYCDLSSMDASWKGNLFIRKYTINDPRSSLFFRGKQVLAPEFRSSPLMSVDGNWIWLGVDTIGTMPIAIQWYSNDVALAGETNSFLYLAGCRSSAGDYVAMASNVFGMSTSLVQHVTFPNSLPPVSINDSCLSMRIDSGSAPFAGSGEYDIETFAANNFYQLIGNWLLHIPNSSGSYSYSVLSNDVSEIFLLDQQLGLLRGTLTFSNVNWGSYDVQRLGGSGWQKGIFMLW
ncbi:MAG: hypothetical protein M1608_05495 [Candidatus Omnitrophica bacterium]|nr:hypothetical protein [Candidatus Omnitrophota bacterium]